jgi:hypothetical protein
MPCVVKDRWWFGYKRLTLSRFELATQNFVSVRERLFTSDVQPLTLYLECLYRFASIEPLHETARLICVVPGSQICC